MTGLQTFLNDALGWFPLFGGPVSAGTVFIAGIVLAIMILPIITAMSPRGLRADARPRTRRARSPSARRSGR